MLSLKTIILLNVLPYTEKYLLMYCNYSVFQK